MNELDELLNTIRLSTAPQTSSSQEETTLESQVSYSLTNEDYDNILADMGFGTQPQNEEEGGSGEEVVEENTVYVDTSVSTATVAEEDADNAIREAFARREEEIENGFSTEVLERLEALGEYGQRRIAERSEGHPSIEEEPESPIEESGPIIQPNSPTLMINETTSRFSGTEWYNNIQTKRIILAGLGGIGSNAAYQLARMNPEALVLYDDDNVEAANMSGQMYSFGDIGKSKVLAVSEKLREFATVGSVYAIPERFTVDSEAGDIMICGFDNMIARKHFFDAWYNNLSLNKKPEERKNCLFIDGRLDINTLQVFCITGDDEYNIDKYRNEFLFDDSEADETVCSLKQTTYLACMIGSFITNLFTNWVANLSSPAIPYDLPFFTEYDAQNMLFKTEN